MAVEFCQKLFLYLMRWSVLKYWSFSFSIIPSKEIPGLIPLEWTGWISLQSKGLSRVLQHMVHLAWIKSFPTTCSLCDPMDCSMPGLPVYQLLEFTQTHIHRVGDAIQPSHPLSSPSPPIFNLSQHQGLFQWVSSSHQVAKVLELQHQSFWWIFRTDFL